MPRVLHEAEDGVQNLQNRGQPVKLWWCSHVKLVFSLHMSRFGRPVARTKDLALTPGSTIFNSCASLDTAYPEHLYAAVLREPGDIAFGLGPTSSNVEAEIITHCIVSVLTLSLLLHQRIVTMLQQRHYLVKSFV